MSTFTQALRERGEDGLVDLLERRPDLAAPPPSSVRSLAVRATNRTSLDRALAGVDARVLQVLEAVVALDAGPGGGGVPLARLAQATGEEGLDEAVGTALGLALLWSDDDALRPAPGLAEALGPHPAGLGPPLRATLARRGVAALRRLAAEIGADVAGDGAEGTADDADDEARDRLVAAVAARLAEPATLTGLLEDARVRAVLDALAWGPPVGRAPDPKAGTPARAAVDRALALGLLASSDAQHVVLPREIGLALRDGRTHAAPALPPVPEGRAVPAAAVAAESAHAAEELVRLAGAVLTAWGEDPAPALRGGGLGRRELRRLATALGTDDDRAALVVEVLGAAGLVAEDGEETASIAPTVDADDWLDRPVPERWAVLASAWLESERAAWLVGTRTEQGTLRPALDPESRRPWAPRLRRSVLEVLAAAPSAALAADDVLTVLTWRAPRTTPPQHAVEAVLAEAGAVGVTGAGALAPAGAALVGRVGRVGRVGTDEAADDDAVAAALEAQLPPAVEEVLLQGDLTGIVPGRPSPALAALLDLAADVESRGAATTVRFTEASVRRALDTGRTAEELLADLSRHARAGVPQPLEYLVLDVARRHGLVRVGMASAYVRADDPALLAGLAEDPALRDLGLLRLAPTVLAAQAPPVALLAALRERGLAPVTEDATGHVVVGAVAGPRHRVHRGPRRAPAGPPVAEAAEARARRLRRVAADLLAADRRERAAAAAPPDPGTETPPAPQADPVLGLDVLREAVATGAEVWLETVDPTGRPVRRRVRPLRVDGGRVRVLDTQRETEMTVAVHRIATVTPA